MLNPGLRKKGKTMKFFDVVRDKITGFEGVYYGRSEYANGCVHIGIKSQTLKDGKPLDLEWFDIQQVEVVEQKKEPQRPLGGGPAPR